MQTTTHQAEQILLRLKLLIVAIALQNVSKNVAQNASAQDASANVQNLSVLHVKDLSATNVKDQNAAAQNHAALSVSRISAALKLVQKNVLLMDIEMDIEMVDTMKKMANTMIKMASQ